MGRQTFNEQSHLYGLQTTLTAQLMSREEKPVAGRTMRKYFGGRRFSFPRHRWYCTLRPRSSRSMAY
jgi:hypothetical protein